MNNKSNIYDRKYIKLIYNRFFNLPRYNLRFNGYKQTRSWMISIELFERCPGVKIVGKLSQNFLITIIEPN